MILGKGCPHKPKSIPYILRGGKALVCPCFTFSLCTGVFSLHICMCLVCVHFPWKLEEGREPLTGDTDYCGLSCGCCKSNPRLLQWHPVLLTAETSLPALFCLYLRQGLIAQLRFASNSPRSWQWPWMPLPLDITSQGLGLQVCPITPVTFLYSSVPSL